MSPSIRVGALFLVLHFTALSGVLSEYETIYLEDTCKTNETIRIFVGANEEETSQIIKGTREPTSLPNRNCTVYVLPPFGRGITISVRYLNLNPLTEPQCQNYVLITGIEGLQKEVRLCSHSDDHTEFQSYFSNGRLNLLFHTEDSDYIQSYFTFVVTAFVNKSLEDYKCPLNWFQCGNSQCVWKGLTCDGHNNCGDQSDEHRSACDENHGENNYGIVIGATIGSVLLFLLFGVLPLVSCFSRLKAQRRTFDEERRNFYTRLRDEDMHHTSGANITSDYAENGSYQNQPPPYKP